tara:strand:+ start:717 stop:2297 length:1581 start_codon:yes stop_codon:yes gene_type:complete
MPKNRHLQNIVGTEHITDAAEQAIAAQAEGGATLAFKNVAVAGQSNIVADAATDTLNIAAGANVTITTNASTDTITIAATDTNTDTNTFRPVTAGGNTLGASETLAFTAGSNVTISESAGAVTIAATGGSPGGSDGQIQYNNGGSFGGSSLSFDDTDGSEQFLFTDTSDTALVKIEQLGTGNALEVHDAASDTSIFKVRSNGTIAVGLPSDTGFGYGLLYVNGIVRASEVGVGSGSASGPTHTFEGDQDTGMYRANSDELAFSTGGSERFRIASSGQLGVAGANYGSAGQVLTSQGSSAAPSWTTLSTGGNKYAAFSGYEPVGGSNSFASSNDILNISQQPYGPYNGGLTNSSYSQSYVMFVPFVLPLDKTLTHLCANVNTASSTSGLTLDLGLYSTDSYGMPSTLECSSSIPVTSTGTKEVAVSVESGRSAAITGGEMYYIGFAFNQDPSSSYPIMSTAYKGNTQSGHAGGPFGRTNPFLLGSANGQALRHQTGTQNGGLPTTISIDYNTFPLYVDTPNVGVRLS